jgi:polyvinyl alcohol dehydrogenase (cytochrome)
MKKPYKITAGIAFISSIALIGWADQNSPGSGQWPLAGHDLSNSWNQPSEHQINSSTVGTLNLAWSFTTGGSVSATPTVAGNAIYFPDWAGNLYAVENHTGQLIWSHKISDYDGFPTAISRVSPAVHGNELIFGDNENPNAAHDGANIIAVDRQTGARIWSTNVESHPAAIITGPPVVYGDVVYVGVSSIEESTLAKDPSYKCCTFRGSVVALDANTGGILWKMYDVPDNHGATDQYSGGAIWQPPAIDPQRGVLYIGTGNNYTVPASVLACQAKAEAANDTNTVCTPTDDYIDTALALDLKTGTVKWSHNTDIGNVEWAHRVLSYDNWTIGCTTSPPNSNCPTPKGPDFDLGGAGPNLLDHLVGFGQKSGVYWAFSPDDGHVLWNTLVGPAGTGTLGGIEWGTATDGNRIYTEIAWGSWSALDAKTGKILWQTADPTPGSMDFGAVSVANGVVYAGSQGAPGFMYAMDAATGKILWSFASGGSVIDGPSIADGFVYWGSGYRIGTNNNKLYAFAIPGGRGKK